MRMRLPKRKSGERITAEMMNAVQDAIPIPRAGRGILLTEIGRDLIFETDDKGGGSSEAAGIRLAKINAVGADSLTMIEKVASGAPPAWSDGETFTAYPALDDEIDWFKPYIGDTLSHMPTLQAVEMEEGLWIVRAPRGLAHCKVTQPGMGTTSFKANLYDIIEEAEGDSIFVSKPYHLQKNPFTAGQVDYIDGSQIIYSDYASDGHERIATDANNETVTESQELTPSYFVGEIVAIMPVRAAVSVPPLIWQDINEAGRFWARSV